MENPNKKVSDEELVNYLKDHGLYAAAQHFGARIYAIEKRIPTLIKRGLLPKDFADRRQIMKKLPDDEILKELYLKKGWGVVRISKEYDVSDRNVSRRLKILGVLDSSRMCKASGQPRCVRRPKSKEFTDSVKKERFSAVQGICEYCGRPIVGGWRTATYHHRKPIKFGGNGALDNCMALHRACHEDHFYELHGFENPYK